MSSRNGLLVIFAMALLAGGVGAQSLNRIQMDNGAEGYWWLSSQTPHHTDPANGLVDGDVYWKVLPANAARRCSGETRLHGLEAWNLDTDWDASEGLYGWVISPSIVDASSGARFPDYVSAPTPPTVYVPEVLFTGSALPFFGNPAGPGGCPPPSYVGGWLYQDLLEDTAGNPLVLSADGSVDWCFSHLFPGGMDYFTPATNGCGLPGDFSFSFAGSHDDLAQGFGENQPDLLGNGLSTLGGLGIAGTFYAEEFNGGAELAFLFDEPTLQPHVNTGIGAQASTEMGLAGNYLGIGVDCQTVQPVGAGASLGMKMFDQQAAPGDQAVFFGNIGPTLLDMGLGCVPFAGAELALNPSDPVLLSLASALGTSTFAPEVPAQQLGSFYGGSLGGDLVATSGQIALSSANCSWVGLTLQIQGFRISGGSLASETNVFTVTLAGSETIQ